MNQKNILTKIFYLLILIIGLIIFFFLFNKSNNSDSIENIETRENMENSYQEKKNNEKKKETEKEELNPFSIEFLRDQDYPGGDFVIEEELPNGSNYSQFIASYQSEGFKINGLLTVPLIEKPEQGYPAIIFIHGYIPPKQYSTTGSYPTYQAALARAGFVTFKPDLRGHDESEGEPVSAHYSEKYVIDTLNAIAYLKNYEEVDLERIGYWGHSNGGEIGLDVAVISKDVKAYSFWAGVVGSYQDELETYNSKISFMQGDNPLVDEYGLPSEGSGFWEKVDPYFFLDDIDAPIQLQHATGDESVPVELSRRLNEELEKIRKEIEYIEYQGDDHNISQNSGIAWQRTIEFFNDNL